MGFSNEAVEKIEVQTSKYDETIGRYICRINKSGICKYMINFIHKLKHLPDVETMNTVLENFTILQQITCRNTNELLFCIAFVFEASADRGPHHHIYHLVSEDNG